MFARKVCLFNTLSALSLALCACGGGGGGTAFIPAPNPSPTPKPTSASAVIFPNPTPQTYASVGTSAQASDFLNLKSPLGTISSATADQPIIRFTSGGMYEVQIPGRSFDTLTLYGQGTGGTVLNDGNGGMNELLVLSGSKAHNYQYSEVARYRSAAPQLIGAFAFGTLTPNGGVPTTGSATYSGSVMGTSDVIASDSFDGPNRAFVEGSVNLNFNFAAGSLGGDMTIELDDAAGSQLSLGTFNFANTVHSVGSTSYSGTFDTSVAGENFFSGKFTGPHAEETIGAWALPFILNSGNSTITADHQAHQLFGAWIAKKP